MVSAPPNVRLTTAAHSVGIEMAGVHLQSLEAAIHPVPRHAVHPCEELCPQSVQESRLLRRHRRLRGERQGRGRSGGAEEDEDDSCAYISKHSSLRGEEDDRHWPPRDRPWHK